MATFLHPGDDLSLKKANKNITDLKEDIRRLSEELECKSGLLAVYMDVAHEQSQQIALLTAALQDTVHWGPAVCPLPSSRTPKWSDTMPWLVTVHCAAHHLALVCKDASESTPYMKTFRDHLQQLHLYFRNSGNRTAVLKAAATTLGICDLKHQAVANLRRNLHAVLTALAEEVEYNKCPVAKGLYSFCATYRFVAALYLQADVLPHLTSVLCPQAARNPDQDVPVSHLKTLAAKFPPMDKNQLAVMRELASQYDELGQLYPCLSKLGAIALTVPVGIVNCERDFSTMYRLPGYNSHNS
ncbi:hypothetical protein CRUP_014399 [Coryphaenoides rupestris]|nr:hypothetical protein CRUP_014399 [Coryphaenoides rupestris]